MDKKPFTVDMKPRGLKYKEVKALRDAGLHLQYIDVKERETKVEDFTYFVLENFYSGVDFDDVDQSVCIKFAADTLAKTYAPEAEAKNS